MDKMLQCEDTRACSAHVYVKDIILYIKITNRASDYELYFMKNTNISMQNIKTWPSNRRAKSTLSGLKKYFVSVNSLTKDIRCGYDSIDRSRDNQGLKEVRQNHYILICCLDGL